METDFEVQHPEKVRLVEIKRKRKDKGKKKAGKERSGNGSESDDSGLEEWIRQEGLGFLQNSKEWGNQGEGKEWVAVQKEINKFQLIKKMEKEIFKENKVTYLEFYKESASTLSGKNKSEKPFEDLSFPAVYLSLTGQWGVMKKYEQVYWERASRMIQNCVIFQEKVSPFSIQQGKLGDCYFLSSLAALAQRPDRIFSAFLSSEITAQRRFSVKILLKGRWQVVDLDEYFPFLKGKPVFSRSSNRELWAMLMEKAWAKLYGSYMNIASGHAEECLHDFTGAPIKFFKLKNNKQLDKQNLWKYLLKASKREYAMCASSNPGSDTKMSQTGIVQGHCYTLLNANYLKFKGQKIRLLQLRNPWGRKQGTNAWNDRDPKWKQVSAAERLRLKFNPNEKDGIFFMQFQDFLYEYRAITIAEIDDSASYVYETVKDPNCQGVCFKVEIFETSRYSFQIDKTPKRFFGVKERLNYKYPVAYCKIFRSNGEQVHNFHDDERTTSRRYTLDKGVYYAMVKIEFNSTFERDYDVTLAVYSQAGCAVVLATRNERQKIGQVSFPMQKLEIKKKRYKSTPKYSNQEELELAGGKPVIKFTYNTNGSQPPQPFQPYQPQPFQPYQPYQQLQPYQPSQPPSVPSSFDPAPIGTNVQIKNKKKEIIIVPQEEPNKPKPLVSVDEMFRMITQMDWVKQVLRAEKGEIERVEVVDIVKNIKKQMIFLEPSPAENRLQRLRLSKQEFQDERFPPNLTSLTGQWGFINEWKNVRWERISKVLPSSKIFRERISPLSIKQGFLGDCYFLAGLAALAEKPQRILNLFLLTERNEINYYSIKLLYRGKWLTVDMDDYLPYMYDLPAFSNTANGELWVVLLEKAWAKVYTSYKRIEAGFPEQTLHDLTGAPIRHIYLRRSTFDPEAEWAYLMKASALEYAMVASSQVGCDELKSVSGIVQGHAYTLLEVVQIPFQNRKQRLVQLRNPWGKGEGVAQWSDADANWNLISQSEKARIGYSKKDDGVFFLSYQLFCQQFKLITVAQINDNASYIYLSCKDQQKQGCFFTVTIHQRGRYSMQVDNTPERTFENHYHTDYKYPQTGFEMGMITDKGYVRKMAGVFANARTLFHSGEFEPGAYICFVKTDYDLKFQKEFRCNLAVYGDYPCKIELSSHKEAVLFSNNPNVVWPREEQQKAEQWNSLRGYNPQRPKLKRQY